MKTTARIERLIQGLRARIAGGEDAAGAKQGRASNRTTLRHTAKPP